MEIAYRSNFMLEEGKIINRAAAILAPEGFPASNPVAGESLNLAALTAPELIFDGVEDTTCVQLIERLCLGLADSTRVANAHLAKSLILKRETACATFVPPDWAIPHARLECPDVSFAFARCSKPLAWFGSKLVKTVFLFVVPEKDARVYLEALASLARLCEASRLYSQFQTACGSAAIYEAFKAVRLGSRDESPGT